MSVVIFTVAELAVLSAMLGGLIRKRSHARPLTMGVEPPPAA